MNFKCAQTGDECIADLFVRYPDLRTVEISICAARDALSRMFAEGGKLLVCGNGGSAADSEHIVGELMKSFRFKRPVDPLFVEEFRRVNGEALPSWLEGALPAISLVSQTALSTAFGNDESSLGVFAQQVFGYGERKDILLAISTSGNSSNVINAAKIAKAKGMKVVSLTGSGESPLMEVSDICIAVPRSEVFQVQEMHLPIYHALCAAVEADLFGGLDL
jgi:phosphoheptose isomerase